MTTTGQRLARLDAALEWVEAEIQAITDELYRESTDNAVRAVYARFGLTPEDVHSDDQHDRVPGQTHDPGTA